MRRSLRVGCRWNDFLALKHGGVLLLLLLVITRFDRLRLLGPLLVSLGLAARQDALLRGRGCL